MAPSLTSRSRTAAKLWREADPPVDFIPLTLISRSAANLPPVAGRYIHLSVVTSVVALAALSGCADGTKTTGSHPSTPARTQAADSRSSDIGGIRLVGRAAGTLPSAVQLPAVSPVGETSLLAIGGLDANDASVSSIIKVTDGSARAAGSLPSAFHDAAAATVGGATYVFGGGEGGVTRNQILRIDGGRTTQVGVLPVGSSDSTAAAIGSKIYVVGGYDGTVGLSTILAFTPPSTVRKVAKLPVPLRYSAVGAVAGKLMIAGGSANGVAQKAVYLFDPSIASVRQVASLPKPITHAAGASLNGVFYVIGGRGDQTTSQVASIYGITPSGKVTEAGRLATPLSDLGAASFADHIIVLGGKNRSGTVQTGITSLSQVSK